MLPVCFSYLNILSLLPNVEHLQSLFHMCCIFVIKQSLLTSPVFLSFVKAQNTNSTKTVMKHEKFILFYFILYEVVR